MLHGDVVWPPGKRRAPPFALRDQRGARVSLSGERGRVVMLTFMYSRCRQVCPIEGRLLAAVERRLGRSTRALLLVVSVDPGGDTVSSIHRFIRHAGLTGARWRWLVGGSRQLAPIWRAYRIDVQAGRDIGHSSALYLIDRHGYERAGYAVPFLPNLVAADVRTLAAERASK
ncbi:MAG TPA: SCO family protein [Solirubrobacteraceae bacterium]|nr:SCO family protein [Solirubrobacteraceae bacterium]